MILIPFPEMKPLAKDLAPAMGRNCMPSTGTISPMAKA